MAVNIHASCVAAGTAGAAFGAPPEAGILLLGPSGAGKSDLALRLIHAGAILVSDDRTELVLEGSGLVASPPAALAGLIEVRNLGIVALPHRRRAPVALVVDLAPGEPRTRLPEPEHWAGPPDLDLAEAARPPLIRLDGFAASAPDKVMLAAAAFARSLLRDTLSAN